VLSNLLVAVALVRIVGVQVVILVSPTAAQVVAVPAYLSDKSDLRTPAKADRDLHQVLELVVLDRGGDTLVVKMILILTVMVGTMLTTLTIGHALAFGHGQGATGASGASGGAGGIGAAGNGGTGVSGGSGSGGASGGAAGGAGTTQGGGGGHH
jgi:hypothetical protein